MLVITFFVLLAIIAYDPNWPWTTLVMIIPIVGGGLAIWSREYMKRPIRVEIYENGVKLHFRYSKPRFIPY